MVNKCCNHDCNQGRDCPVKKERYEHLIKWLEKHAPLTLQKFFRRTKDE